MNPAQKLVGLLVLIVALMAGSAAGAWKVQGWRYGKQHAEQDRLHGYDLDAISNAPPPRCEPFKRQPKRLISSSRNCIRHPGAGMTDAHFPQL
jgi:hypothetical protein